jgi:hypothetical protein
MNINIEHPIKLCFTFVCGVAIATLSGTSIGSLAQAQTGRTEARIRAIHAAPDAPTVDVYLDGKLAFGKMPFKAVGAYAEVPARAHLVQIVPTGNTLKAGPIVISATVTFSQGLDYSVLAVGTQNNLTSLVVVDDNTLPAKGKSVVRLVHASPDAPAVDVATSTATEPTEQKLFANVAFKTTSRYTPVDAGIYNLSVRVAGTDKTALNVKGLTLEERTVYTVYAFGFSNGTPALSVGLSSDANEQTLKEVEVKVILPVTGGRPNR